LITKTKTSVELILDFLYNAGDMVDLNSLSQISAIDPDTGEQVPIAEVFPSVTIEKLRQATKRFRKEFKYLRIYQKSEEYLVRNTSNMAYRVLGYLRSRIYYGNKVDKLSVRKIADDLNCSPTSIHAAIKELREKNIIIVENELGKRLYWLGPNHTWKGSNINHAINIKEWIKAGKDKKDGGSGKI